MEERPVHIVLLNILWTMQRRGACMGESRERVRSQNRCYIVRGVKWPDVCKPFHLYFVHSTRKANGKACYWFQIGHRATQPTTQNSNMSDPISISS